MLHYRCEGSGDPLLLIHGWGVTYTIWQNLAPLLRPHFQLIMIELPGIGGSPEVDPKKPYYPACAEAIEEVRQALNIQQWSHPGILFWHASCRILCTTLPSVLLTHYFSLSYLPGRMVFPGLTSSQQYSSPSHTYTVDALRLAFIWFGPGTGV